MRRFLIGLFIAAQYLLMLFAVLVGFAGGDGIGWKLFALLTLASIVTYSIGLRMLGKTKTRVQHKRGFQLMGWSCLPTLPLSLLFGILPARMIAKDRGLFDAVQLVSSGKEKTAALVPDVATEDTKHFYTRKMFGPYAFWLGVVFAVMMVIGIANGAWSVVGRFGIGAFVCLAYGGANRKPRMTLTPVYLEVVPNPMGSAKRIPLSEISDILVEPKLLIRLKNGGAVRMAKFEFSKHTRAAFSVAAHGRLPA